ncbi:Aspartate-semialdehyde dehydrogenase [Vitis vinifera]|uniref:Aspartate-semialdehyde dehydrogenase n=1 Tax=Vitis vinifera TaxID=29760 RepID=A0A438DGE1_VITVI|nr:Aspartate-semialdehyde dehydrogenase [Vitis vinifera]
MDVVATSMMVFTSCRLTVVVRMVVSTYQAASGAGAAAMEELELQTREVLEGKQPTCKIFKQQYAFNLFSHNAPVLPNGYNEEEMKLVKETRKIWNDMNVKVTATCIRVPVMRAHAESVNLQFENPLDELNCGWLDFYRTQSNLCKKLPKPVQWMGYVGHPFGYLLVAELARALWSGPPSEISVWDTLTGHRLEHLGPQIKFHILAQDKARDILRNAPGVVVIDERPSNNFPTPLEVSNKDDVAVGRIRRDVSQDGNLGKLDV